MYCPLCEYEYPSGVSACPECQVPLLENRSGRSHAAAVPDNSWVQVCGVKSNSRAEKAKGALDSNNIPSVLMPSTLSGAVPGQDSAVSLTQSASEMNVIMVPREFREEAEMVIEAILGDDCIPLDAR
ncbi:MAG: hypothetical protein AB1644_13040 [Candidatus Zixiibacteriota bacterium]